VMPSSEIRARIGSEFPLVPLDPATPGETAQRWGYADGAGEVGFISSVTQAFCGDCNRARLSTEGKVYLCLFASNGYDLRSLMRGGASDAELASAIGHIWQGRSDRYSELRGTMAADTGTAGGRRVEMSYIGG
jgi:cyclic pyranopterin phosphate synthase